jgi:hypothetical protein
MAFESAYKREFRATLGVWSEAYEPARGSGVGYPDLQFLVCGILVPVELKKGRLKGERIYPMNVRPSQIAWLHNFNKAGGRAFLLVCTGEPSRMSAWAIPSIDREVTSKWKQGWLVEDCTQWVLAGGLTTNLSSLVLGMKE